MRSLLSRLSLVLFALVFAHSSVTSADDLQGFELYLSTKVKNNSSAMTVRVGDIDIDHLDGVMDSFETPEGETILPADAKNIQVVIVVPLGTPVDIRNKTKERIGAAVAKRFPKMQVTVQESFVDMQKDEEALRARRTALAEIITQIRSGAPGERETLELADTVLAFAQQENERFLRSWRPNNLGIHHPFNRYIGARVIAATKLGISFTLVLTKYGLNAGSLLVGTVSGSIAAIFGYNANAWSEFCAHHSIPALPAAPMKGPEGEPLGTAAYLTRGAYNVAVPWNPVVGGIWNVLRYPYNKWMPAEGKSATVNLIRTFGVDFIVRGLAHATGQVSLNRTSGEYEPVKSPISWEFLQFGGVLNTLELIGDAAMDAGSSRSERKRHYTALTRSYFLWIIGLMDTAWHNLFRIQANEWALGIGLVSFGCKISLWGISMLPERGPRFTFISDAISQDVGYEDIKKPGFLGYFANMFGNISRSIANSMAGRYSVSDRVLVGEHLGGRLEEAIQLQLDPARMERLANDPALERADFVSWLNLKKVRTSLVNQLWDFRNAHLNEGLTPATLCAGALANPQQPWYKRFFGKRAQGTK